MIEISRLSFKTPILPEKAFSYADAKGILLTRHSAITKDTSIEVVHELLTTRSSNVLSNAFRTDDKTVGDFLDLTESAIRYRNCGRQVISEWANIQKVFHDVIEERKKATGCSCDKCACVVNLHASATIHFASGEDAQDFIRRHKADLETDEKDFFTLKGIRYNIHIYTTENQCLKSN